MLAAAISVLTFAVSCTAAPEGTPAGPTQSNRGGDMASPTATSSQTRMIRPGETGDFAFSGQGPLQDQPIRVWYKAPDDPSSAQILMVMTGAHRDGESYRSDWLPLIQNSNTLLLVLEFSKDDYPGAASYNQGNILDSAGNINPPESWSFNVVESLFQAVVRDTNSKTEKYALFGHSAGGQFVHRFMEFTPTNHVSVAVAANAGWYTMPDQSVEYPYGLKNSPLAPKALRDAFSRRLIILLGADDVDPKDAMLQRDRQTDAQGDNRLTRGLAFYQASRNAAREGDQFNWALSVIPGAAHDHKLMAAAAAPLLLETR